VRACAAFHALLMQKIFFVHLTMIRALQLYWQQALQQVQRVLASARQVPLVLSMCAVTCLKPAYQEADRLAKLSWPESYKTIS
jgi:hypothetical protein